MFSFKLYPQSSCSCSPNCKGFAAHLVYVLFCDSGRARAGAQKRHAALRGATAVTRQRGGQRHTSFSALPLIVDGSLCLRLRMQALSQLLIALRSRRHAFYIVTAHRTPRTRCLAHKHAVLSVAALESCTCCRLA
eukprot:6187304-Pleurochrysis_carterae.AAC.2